MDESQTSVEFASDLYSHLDSSAGDYNRFLSELEKFEDEPEEIRRLIESADNQLEEAFTLLDTVVLEAAEFDGENSSYTEDVESEVKTIANCLENASDTVEKALIESQGISEQNIPDSFKFGVHTTPEDALRYLYGDASRMSQIAFEMESLYPN